LKIERAYLDETLVRVALALIHPANATFWFRDSMVPMAKMGRLAP